MQVNRLHHLISGMWACNCKDFGVNTGNQIAAFIDFDDSISGDPMDDLSLLACFHGEDFLKRAFEGYQSLRMLPSDYLRRFWLHLLRHSRN